MAKAHTPIGWQNRIVGHGEVDPTTLVENPYQWRTHPPRQATALKAILGNVGWVRDILVNQRTGHMLDGHLRAGLAILDNQPTVPVEYVDVSEDEERLILATLDPLAGLAETDREKLGALLHEVTSDDAAIQELLGTIADTNRLYLDSNEVDLGQFQDPDTTAALAYRVVLAGFATKPEADLLAAFLRDQGGPEGIPLTPEVEQYRVKPSAV
jgi:hypothetical protein